MIKIQIDLTDASAAELVEFNELPGMKEVIGALSTRGRKLNVALTMTGGEGAVSSMMSEIAAKLPPHIEYDEYQKVGVPVDDAHLYHSESLDRTEVVFRAAGALGPFNK